MCVYLFSMCVCVACVCAYMCVGMQSYTHCVCTLYTCLCMCVCVFGGGGYAYMCVYFCTSCSVIVWAHMINSSIIPRAKSSFEVARTFGDEELPTK